MKHLDRVHRRPRRLIDRRCKSRITLAALCVLAGFGFVFAWQPVAADQDRRTAAFDVATMRPGLVRRDADGQLILDTSPEAMRIARRQEAERRARAMETCRRGGKVETRVRAPGWLRELVDAMAPKYGLDPELVVAVMAVESNFEVKAVSPKNAQGLMQLIPATAERFGVRDPFDPAENVRGGMKYLSWLLDRFAGNHALALAAYNAGEDAVDRYSGVPPYRETQNYVRAVQRRYGCVPARPAARVTQLENARNDAGRGTERSTRPSRLPAQRNGSWRSTNRR